MARPEARQAPPRALAIPSDVAPGDPVRRRYLLRVISPDDILEQAQWDFFWARNEEATVVDRPELAYIRSERDLIYLNSVARVRGTPAQMEALVREVSDAHAGVASRWLICPQSRPLGIEAALEAHGYQAGPVGHAYVIPVGDFRPREVRDLDIRRVDRMERLRDWFGVAALAFETEWKLSDAELRKQLADCRDPAGRIHRFVAYDAKSGAPISAGDIRLFPALGFGYLLAGCTVPEARGRGAYSALLEKRVEIARERGVSLVGLYGDDQTSGRVVMRQGFEKHGPMTFWTRPAGE